jgi:hypothetical protein
MTAEIYWPRRDLLAAMGLDRSITGSGDRSRRCGHATPVEHPDKFMITQKGGKGGLLEFVGAKPQKVRNLLNYDIAYKIG